MRRSDFNYNLPDELIARYPVERRSASKLLALDGSNGGLRELIFDQLTTLLRPGDLLVFNRTRVIPARLFAKRGTGGKVEILVERVLSDYHVRAYLNASKTLRQDELINLDGGGNAQLLSRDNELWELKLSEPVMGYLQEHGHVPLPPYLRRADEQSDSERYQTVYADRPGAVAAPTAGLHFDDKLMQEIESSGVNAAFLTLHVGAGTFQPVRTQDLGQHRMHAEQIIIEQDVCDAVAKTRAAGCRVIAVGTTSVRALESLADRTGVVRPDATETRLFITPGYRFAVVDALITNFHLPESTLLMMVCAFSGYEQVMNAYRHAVLNQYRFFSYGDAMFLTRSEQ